MESLGWGQRRGSSPAARRGARQRAGLTPVSASNTLSCERETPHPKPNQKTPLTVITVSMGDLAGAARVRRRAPNGQTMAEMSLMGWDSQTNEWSLRAVDVHSGQA